MMLSYKKYGEGKPLFILHGLYGSSDNWVTIGKKLADKFAVYLIDQRNHGDSPHHDQHSYKDMAQDLFELLEHLNITEIYLAGHSMGGKTAMVFAAMYPKAVKKLMVLDISPKSHLQAQQQKEVFSTHRHILSTLHDMDIGQFDSRKEIDMHMAKRIPSQGVRQFLLKNLKRDKNNRFKWKINVGALNSYIDEILGDINLEDYGTTPLTVPTAFVNGGKSVYLSEEDKPYIKEIFESCTFHTIPESGHWVHAEAPEKTFNLMIDFFS